MNYEEIKKIAKQLKGQPIFVESIKNNQLLDEYQRALQTLISAVGMIEELKKELAEKDKIICELNNNIWFSKYNELKARVDDTEAIADILFRAALDNCNMKSR